MTENLPGIRETLCTDRNGQEKLQIPVKIRNALKEPTFNVWDIQNEEMLTLLEHMFYDLELVTRFRIDAVTLQKFLRCLQSHYRKNPFHNFRHAFCVTQMMYSVVSQCNLQ
ncbi:high affinity cGMP-specific 3',5'-cyclic phosphodiesterase 9A-like, partial [Pseudophryne corroboree]|uniref:high affinity cGMP-specific 3',5'-cyclic phosphodiesterase 9A-like n=1 Tax=Pseudophryne corroboree TaxID=495146 RepID=UPI003081BD0F